MGTPGRPVPRVPPGGATGVGRVTRSHYRYGSESRDHSARSHCRDPQIGLSQMDEDVNPTGGAGPGAMVPRGSIRAPLLVVGAVAAGIVLYLVIHHVGSGGVPTGAASATSTPSVTTPSTSTTPATGTPSTVRLVVLNGAGTSATAVTKIATLHRLGYPIVATVTSAPSTGDTVQCKTGLSKEASSLASALGGATVKPFPSPAPAVAPLLECLVTIGK